MLFANFHYRIAHKSTITSNPAALAPARIWNERVDVIMTFQTHQIGTAYGASLGVAVEEV